MFDYEVLRLNYAVLRKDRPTRKSGATILIESSPNLLRGPEVEGIEALRPKHLF